MSESEIIKLMRYIRISINIFSDTKIKEKNHLILSIRRTKVSSTVSLDAPINS